MMKNEICKIINL